MLFKTICDNSGKLNIHAVCACQKIKSDQKLVTYKRSHQPDHVNTTFGFDNRNEFNRMEAKSVHVNVAIDAEAVQFTASRVNCEICERKSPNG